MSRGLSRAGLYLLAGIIALAAAFPFYYAAITSLKSGDALFSMDLLPRQWHWDNYVAIFAQQPFATTIVNSFWVATGVVSVSLMLGLSAAYALSRNRFRGRRLLMMTILSVSMFPQVAVLSGMFELIRWLGLYNRIGGLMLSYLIITLPFTVWVLATFMRRLPREVEEAAIMDGAGPLTIIWRIFLPPLMPALFSTGLLAFIAAWNEFLFALTFTLTHEQRTVPVAIALLSGASEYELPWGHIMAASVTVTVPAVVLVLIFQRRIVSGLAAGTGT